MRPELQEALNIVLDFAGEDIPYIEKLRQEGELTDDPEGIHLDDDEWRTLYIPWSHHEEADKLVEQFEELGISFDIEEDIHDGTRIWKLDYSFRVDPEVWYAWKNDIG